ncbi:hypothetical protein C2S51_013039 [Perilla frutescens var. frutescens]|nr:hypothetical protein C2S51_013039 [Perilla frutescens var. frutescens]
MAASSILPKWIYNSNSMKGGFGSSKPITPSSSSSVSFCRRSPIRISISICRSGSGDGMKTKTTSTSPWLMLPPVSECGNSICKFYSPAEKEVVSFRHEEGIEFPDDNNGIKFVGSSHGWVVSFDSRAGDMFLFNPVSGRRINLPSTRTIPMEDRLIKGDGYSNVTSVILSCSPDDDHCRALMIYSPHNRLAFCCPGHSTKLFYCVTRYNDFEAWDLHDPHCPRPIPLDYEIPASRWPGEEWEHLREYFRECKSLVISEQSGELFHLSQYSLDRMSPCGEARVQDVFHNLTRGYDVTVPYKTLGFDVDVLKYDGDGDGDGVFRATDRCLNGLALFVGKNHSFAIATPELEGLKPNAIYFTDQFMQANPSCSYGGHDLGIFDCETSTISPCYYHNIRRIVPAPMWLTPNHN